MFRQQYFNNLLEKQIEKIKENKLKNKIFNKIRQAKENPEIGKPLRYSFRNHRSLRIGKHRIIYRFDEEKEILYILTFDHREKSYEEKRIFLKNRYYVSIFFNIFFRKV